jgi:hypothetical protein
MIVCTHTMILFFVLSISLTYSVTAGSLAVPVLWYSSLMSRHASKRAD